MRALRVSHAKPSMQVVVRSADGLEFKLGTQHYGAIKGPLSTAWMAFRIWIYKKRRGIK